MNEINEKIKAMRMKDIRLYCTALTINVLLCILILIFTPTKILLVGFFVLLSIVSGYCLYKELNIYRNPTKNLIYKKLSYIGNKEEIDRYVDNQLNNCFIDDEYIRLTQEFLFIKRNCFDVFFIKDINSFSISPSTLDPERQILIHVNSNDGHSRFISTLKKATEENLSELSNKVDEFNQKILELKPYNN